MAEPQRDGPAREQHQPVAPEMPKPEVFGEKLLEHRGHLRAL